MKRSLALHSAMIVDRTDEGAFHFVTLHAPGIAAQARPGQFIQVLPPHDPGEFFLPRPMSIMLAERKTGHVHFAFKEAGRGTRRLATTRRGDTLRVFGPLGRGWSTPASKQTLLLIGGGVGFPPLYFQAWKQSSERGNNNSPVFVVGARSAEELDYADRIRALGVDIRIATDDGSREFHGNAVGLMEEIVAERDDVDWRIQACGPMPMLAGVARVATGLGLDAEVSLETPMACGVGACMGCALPIEPTGTSTSKLTILCDQGPVYDAAEPDWAALEQQSRSASAPSRRVERAVVSTIFAGIEMANPVVLASGTFGYGAEYGRIIDLDRVGGPLRIAPAVKGVSYAFNVSGQLIDVGSLLCLHDVQGPCANAVKDSQRTKTHEGTRRCMYLIWGTSDLPGRCAETATWARELLAIEGAEVRDVDLTSLRS